MTKPIRMNRRESYGRIGTNRVSKLTGAVVDLFIHPTGVGITSDTMGSRSEDAWNTMCRYSRMGTYGADSLRDARNATVGLRIGWKTIKPRKETELPGKMRIGSFKEMKEVYKSKVYTDRPDYADFESPRKFQTIESIIAKRLREHPNAICSYSGGSDSDIMIDIIERTRKIFNLPPVKYVFFNTGLEMKATKDHVKDTAEKYGIEIDERRPEVNIVNAVRRYGIPFVSKIMSGGLSEWQKKGIPLSIADEYDQALDKAEMRKELKERYPNCESVINFLCCCNSAGDPRPNIQLVINSSKYMRDFISEYPPDFKISAKCCDYCKKQVAHKVQSRYDMVITGERRDEGGMRLVPRKDNTALCFTETANGKYRLRPLYYVTDKDKAWYKEYYGITYSDAYEVYGLTRTGCCGCQISYKAVDDLEKIRKYEPNVVKAAWNIFGKSYEYRKKYNEYKRKRIEEEKSIEGQMNIFDFIEDGTYE